MKAFVVFLLILCVALIPALPVHAQAPAAQDDNQSYTAQELDTLLGPIALYPDSLIALILPASTVPSDITLAAQFISAGVDPAQIPNQPWDDSVKALANYPDIVKWMNQNIDWTTQVGQAFVAQPADVMDSIQQLRAKARAEGNLVDTPQQEVGVDDGDITIESADPDSIYVPQYDPDLVYDEPYSDYGYPLIGFGSGYPIGPWLNYGFNWRRRGIYTGDWRGGRDHHGHGNFAGNNPGAGNIRPWHANPNRVHTENRTRPANVAQAAVVRPKPLPGAVIPRGNRTRPALQTGHLVTSGLRTGNVAAPVAPTQPPPGQNGVVFDAYGRGTVARDAGIRGQASRQSTGQMFNRPAVGAAPVVRPPVQSFSRPVAPVFHAAQPPPARSFQPAPPPRAPAPPAAGAFQGMSSGAAAGGFGARGAMSRGR